MAYDFKHYAYSNRNAIPGESQDDLMADVNKDTFAGGDLTAYFGPVRVSNLEQITCSISSEIAPNYVMGNRNPVAFTRGKRVFVGNMVLSQYDRHALIEQVFQLTQNKIYLQGDFWSDALGDKTSDNAGYLLNAGTPVSYYTYQGPAGAGTIVARGASETSVTSGPRGTFTAAEFEQQISQKLKERAQMVANTKVDYSDQLPAFDITIVGVTKSGTAARAALLGVEITQETWGWSQNDLGNSTGMSFVCKGVSPWRPIVANDGRLSTRGF